MTRDTLDRRSMLKLTAVGASAALAGCSSSGGDGGSGGGSGDGGSGDGGSGSNSVDFGGWFEQVSNFDGVTDKTGQSEVTVKVGAQGNGGGFAFAPPAVKVSKGTTVVWKWTGKGGSHNVIAKDGSFESKLTGEKGHTFSHKFTSSGTYKYFCRPHKPMGMKGAVVVE